MTALGVRLGAPAYSVATASRGATMALVAPLAVELAPRRIRVNAVSPGAIDTAAFDKLGLPREARAAFGEWVLSRVLLGRMGKADEVAKAVAFLLSDDSSYVNGAILAVDGGMRVS